MFLAKNRTNFLEKTAHNDMANNKIEMYLKKYLKLKQNR